LLRRRGSACRRSRGRTLRITTGRYSSSRCGASTSRSIISWAGRRAPRLTLGAAIQLVTPPRDEHFRRLSMVCHWTGIIGSTVGAGFLIHDLGRAERFLYMMRVFRPTSPMNLGTWILSGAAPTAIVTGLLVNRPGVLGKIAEVTGYLSGIFGAALAGYT